MSSLWSARGAQVLQGSFLGNQLRIPGQLHRQGQPLQLPSSLLRLRPHSLGQCLPETIQRKVEALFRAELSDVRLHVGGEAASIGARAFTLGPDIYFAHGQYDFASPHSQRLLGHELAHVLQQRSGRARNPFGTGIAVVQDGGLEAEAERMGLAMARMQSSQRTLPIQPAIRAQPIGPRALPVHSRPVQAKQGGYARPKPPGSVSRQSLGPACVQKTTNTTSSIKTEMSSEINESVLKPRPSRLPLASVSSFKVVKINESNKDLILKVIANWRRTAESASDDFYKKHLKLLREMPGNYYGEEQRSFRESYRECNYKRKQMEGSVAELETIQKRLGEYKLDESSPTEWYWAEAHDEIGAIVEIDKKSPYIHNLAADPGKIVSTSGGVRGAASVLIGFAILKARALDKGEVELYALNPTVKDFYWRRGFDVVKEDKIIERPIRPKTVKSSSSDVRKTEWHSRMEMRMTSERAESFLETYQIKMAISNLESIL